MAREDVVNARRFQLNYVVKMQGPEGEYTIKGNYIFAAPNIVYASKKVAEAAEDAEGIKKEVMEELKEGLEEGHLVKDIRFGFLVDITPPVQKKFPWQR
jgi:hypothetical protein